MYQNASHHEQFSTTTTVHLTLCTYRAVDPSQFHFTQLIRHMNKFSSHVTRSTANRETTLIACALHVASSNIDISLEGKTRTYCIRRPLPTLWHMCPLFRDLGSVTHRNILPFPRPPSHIVLPPLHHVLPAGLAVPVADRRSPALVRETRS